MPAKIQTKYRKCPSCKTKFIAKRSDAVYCSDACRMRFKRAEACKQARQPVKYESDYAAERRYEEQENQRTSEARKKEFDLKPAKISPEWQAKIDAMKAAKAAGVPRYQFQSPT